MEIITEQFLWWPMANKIHLWMDVDEDDPSDVTRVLQNFFLQN